LSDILDHLDAATEIETRWAKMGSFPEKGDKNCNEEIKKTGPSRKDFKKALYRTFRFNYNKIG
jgi:hypothetical protein